MCSKREAMVDRCFNEWRARRFQHASLTPTNYERPVKPEVTASRRGVWRGIRRRIAAPEGALKELRVRHA